VSILDSLQFDVFHYYFKKTKPHFSTFYLNSTAHLQHMYWRNMDPSAFKLKPTPDEQKIYSEAILFGYQEMDELLGDFIKFFGDEVILVLATALGQQACTLYEDIGGKRYCRPIDIENIIRFATIKSEFKVAPVMAEEFFVHFNSKEDALLAEKLLSALRVNSLATFMVVNKGKSLFVGCKIFQELPKNSTLYLLDENGDLIRQAPFFDYFYQTEDKKSGMHHPEGLLWIKRTDREAKIHLQKLPLNSVAPTLLNILGIEKLSSMKGEAVILN
jgi:hypothetical protein